MSNDSTQTTTKNLGRLRAPSIAEPTTKAQRRRRNEDGPTAVETESRLAALAALMTLDERAVGESTLVDPEIAERVANERAVAQAGADDRDSRPVELERSHLGKYRLLRHLAAGRTSHIYLARLEGPAGFARYSAIKALRAIDAQNPQGAAALIETARLLSQLHHGNIAQISDVGVDGDTHYVVMEYLYGMSLRSALARAAAGLPLEVAISAAVGCAEALHYARSRQSDPHTRRLGLSPSQVMACSDGAIKLLRLERTDAAGSTPTEALGYLSPEHVRGESIDARSEVFSLGVMLYELASGVHPYLEPTSEATARAARDLLLRAEVEPLSERFPHVPAELSSVVMSALARDRERRPRDCRALSWELLDVARRCGLRPGPLAVGQCVRQLQEVAPPRAAPRLTTHSTATTHVRIQAARPGPAAGRAPSIAECEPGSPPPAPAPDPRRERSALSGLANGPGAAHEALATWAAAPPRGPELMSPRLRARGTKPLPVLARAGAPGEPWPRAADHARAATVSCRARFRPLTRRRVSTALVLICVVTTLIAGLLISRGLAARLVSSTVEPARLKDEAAAGGRAGEAARSDRGGAYLSSMISDGGGSISRSKV